MSSVWVGVDVSTRKLAFVAHMSTGEVRCLVRPLDGSLRGARRLHHARLVAERTARTMFPDAACVAVELPFTPHQNVALMGVAAVTLEAVQAAVPGAVVLDVNTGVWKRDTVGFGNASKEHVMAHARAQGYDGSDQDVADAWCIAVFAREAWLSEVRWVAA